MAISPNPALGRAPPPAPNLAPGRLPGRIQHSQFGSTNAAATTVGRASPPKPVVLQLGPVLAREQTADRQVNQIQTMVAAAIGQVKALPWGDGNLLEDVPLVQGGASGAGPYNVLLHGLPSAFSGYIILGAKGGAITGHGLVANASSALDARQIQLWITFDAFAASVPGADGSHVWADIWVYR